MAIAAAASMAHEDHGDHEMTAAVTNSSSSHDEMDMDPSPVSMHSSHHHHGLAILDDPNLEPQQRKFWEAYNTTTFFSAPAPNKGFLYAHATLSLSSWFFVYPVALMLSVAGSALYLPVQTAHSIMVVVSLFCLAVYGATAPEDLYPNNSYSKMSIAMFFITIVHWLAAVVSALADRAIKGTQFEPIDGADFVLQNLSDSYRDEARRLSRDSGHGLDVDLHDDSSALNRTDPAVAEGFEDSVNASRHSSADDEESLLFSDSDTLAKPITPMEVSLQDKFLSKLMSLPFVSRIVSSMGLVASTIYTLLNRVLFVVGFAYVMLGIATAFRLGMGNKVFNLLAHFIKGGVFFLFGILQLGRYMGAFADCGMAWNAKPEDRDGADQYRFQFQHRRGLPANPLQRLLGKIRFPSMEFVESFTVFTYGVTNVFLERLANPHGAWAHKDLQHVSIAFMYIGGGLCGLVVESSSIRRAMAKLVGASASEGGPNINPFPAFIVFWTGVLMSQHEQELPLSTTIHMQWGYLLSIGALFRLGTYVLMLISPPKSSAPSRPFTELIVSFCLICGGMVFIQSNRETVYAMIYRGLDGMFTLNVNVGICALIMSWEMIVMAIRGWAQKR